MRGISLFFLFRGLKKFNRVEINGGIAIEIIDVYEFNPDADSFGFFKHTILKRFGQKTTQCDNIPLLELNA